MREGEALLRAVCAAPEDDAVRLVYADWLDDNGDPERAEFIRTQIELSLLEETDEQFDDLKQRERELLATNAERWEAEALEGITSVTIRDAWDEPFFWRGFPYRLYVPARATNDFRSAAFIREAETIFERIPAQEVFLQ